MFSNIEKFLTQLKKQLHNSSDVSTRVLECGEQKIGFVYLKSMTDPELFTEGIFGAIESYKGEITLEALEKEIICTPVVEKVDESQIIEKVLKGNVIVILQNESQFMSIDIQKFPQRTPSEPPTSPVIRGPREGFTEDLKTNLTLIRRRFYSEHLALKNFKVGRYSQTDVMVAYIDGVAEPKVVKQICKKLEKIDIDGIIDTYYILNFLEEKPKSFFKQGGVSEKPDVVAAKMLEGRVAIFVDGSPIVLTLPFMLVEDLQSPNDYYTSNFYATFVRIIRIIGVMLAVIVPGVYLSLRLFHYNVMPLKFLITIADTTKGIPFTPFIELLFILLLFQILYEVSLRLPSYLGLATSVVGALILGDTGVKAGLISPPGVIVIALAKIAVYTVPEQAPQLIVLQVLFLILGGGLGLLGIVGGLVFMFAEMNSLDSYGAPYLAPYSPRISEDLKDALYKSHLKDMKKRPKSFGGKNKTRQK